MRPASAFLLLWCGLGACGFAKADLATVPTAPTFERDVAPLFADHCLLCHGENAKRGAPDRFRLDRYDDAGDIRGARAMAGAIYEAVVEDEMPPAAAWGDGLGANAKEVLRLWVEQGAPRSAAAAP